MEKGYDDQCPILFVWDGEWDCDMNNHRWKFMGKQSKTVLVHPNITFSQLLDKAYVVSNVNIEEYQIEMSSWFAYQYQDPLPPCPLADDDDVRILLRVNREKYLSVPLCLMTRKRIAIGKTQCKRESQSSNQYVVPFETQGTIVPEIQPPIIPYVDKGKCIVSELPQMNCEDFVYGLDESDSFFYDNMDEPAFGSPIRQNGSGDNEDSTPVNDISLVRDDPSPVTNAQRDVHSSFVLPHPINNSGNVGRHNLPPTAVTDNKKKKSVGTGQSGVGNQSRTLDESCNSISIENDLEVGKVFLSKDDLIRQLKVIVMMKNREYRVKKSDTTRFVAICVDPNCNWRLRVSKLKTSETLWVVKRYHNVHTCSLDIMNHDHRQASSKVLGELIKYRYATPTHVYPPRAVITEVKNRLNVNISYDKAWRAREEALRLVRGSPEDSFKQLPAYLERVKQVNPGTITHIETDEDGHFKYCFMALGVSIRGFLTCIRPVLATDATHLKGKYRGILFVATGMDGNNQIYPLAFAIGDSENDASWEWFLRKIHGIIGDLADLVIISDRHLSIEKAVHEVFQYAYHGICMYHLKQNVLAKFRHVVDVKAVSALLLCAAKTYREAEFSHLMNEILRISRQVHDYLIDAGIERWARVYSTGRRYSILTTNIAESLNAVLRDVREYPPVTLLDGILMMMLNWFVKRRDVAANMQTTLTTWAENKVRSRDKFARRMDASPIHHYTWFVLDGDRNAQVDLNEKTCTCNVFQLDQLPCSHALAAAAKLNVSRYGLASKFYTSDALVAAYAEPIFPVGHVELWETSEEIANIALLPPIMRVPAGRRRKNRILSQGEEHVRKKCGRCGGNGHNRKTCRNPIPVVSSKAALPQ